VATSYAPFSRDILFTHQTTPAFAFAAGTTMQRSNYQIIIFI
jgi:hypothetical protein